SVSTGDLISATVSQAEPECLPCSNSLTRCSDGGMRSINSLLVISWKSPCPPRRTLARIFFQIRRSLRCEPVLFLLWGKVLRLLSGVMMISHFSTSLLAICRLQENCQELMASSTRHLSASRSITLLMCRALTTFWSINPDQFCHL